MESCPSGSISMRRPLGMIMVGARLSGLDFMVLLLLRLELRLGARRQRLEALDRPRIAGLQQQPVVVRPAAGPGEKKRGHGGKNAPPPPAAPPPGGKGGGGPTPVSPPPPAPPPPPPPARPP